MEASPPTNGLFAYILNQFKKIGVVMENGIVRAKEFIAEKARLKKIELEDEKTGEIYCVRISDGNLVHSKGECGLQNLNSENTSISTPTPEPTSVESASPEVSASPTPTPVETAPEPTLTPASSESPTPSPSPESAPSQLESPPPPISTSSPTPEATLESAPIPELIPEII